MKTAPKSYYLFLFLLFILFSCNKEVSDAEQTSLDSLLQIISDSLNRNPTYAHQLLKDAELKATDSMQYYQVKEGFMRYYATVGQYDSVLYLARQMKLYAARAIELPNKGLLLENANNAIGVCFMNQNNLDSALYYYLQAYSHGISVNDNEKLPDICINVADAYTRKGDFLNGISYYRKALDISETLKMDDAIKFPIYFGLGQAYFMGLRNFELSDEFFKKAELLYDGRSIGEKFVFCNNRGNYYYYKEEYANALPWFIKAMRIVEPIKSDYHINYCNANLGDVYLHLNQLDSAEYCLEKSYRYFEFSEDKTMLFYIATVKAELALTKGNVKYAKQILSKYPESKSIEPEILGIRYKTLQRYYIKTADYKNAFDAQSKAFNLNDSIRSERVKNAIAELDARYRQDTILMNKEFLIHEKDLKIKDLKFVELFRLSMTLVVVLIGLTTFLFFKRRKDIQQARLMETVSKYRLQNLRVRVSPHFLFNVLNRQISTEGDEQKNKETLEVVKLLRKSLEMNDKIAIPLSDEIEFVQRYLNVEKNSLGQDFLISWNIDKDLNPESWEVPAMIIQIPVENALKHAFRNMMVEKRLTINLHQTAIGLQVSIIDNGSGFHPESNVDTAGTKNGLKLLYGIIQLLNQNNDKKLILEIKNIEQNNVTGTEVVMTIPVNYNYSLFPLIPPLGG